MYYITTYLLYVIQLQTFQDFVVQQYNKCFQNKTIHNLPSQTLTENVNGMNFHAYHLTIICHHKRNRAGFANTIFDGLFFNNNSIALAKHKSAHSYPSICSGVFSYLYFNILLLNRENIFAI